MQLSTDASGNVHVGRNPFTDSGPVVIDQARFLRGVIIIRVETAGKVGYGFLESSEFNMAYERGQTTLANYELKVNLLN